MKSIALAALFLPTAAAAQLSISEINGADPLSGEDRAAMIRLQVLLDRSGASVGYVDGYMGEATRAALRAFEAMNGMTVDGELDPELWAVLEQGGPATETYTLTEEDAGFEATPEIPEDYEKMAEMDHLGYHSHQEMLAERFQMDPELLAELNPEADFTVAGTEITVAATRVVPEGEVMRITVNRDTGRLEAFDGTGEDAKLIFAAPAAVGSQQTPSPSGSMKVTAIAADPTYTYDPENLPNADFDEVVQIAAGPNGPVGSMWIDLGKPTYGIHGTPYPTEITSMASHGCVRLTNWDAEHLAQLVKPGETVVEFTGG